MDRWGYGVLWWVWDSRAFPGGITNGPLQGANRAMGSGGQFITVIPSADLVTTHKVDIDKDSSAAVDALGYDAILALVLNPRSDSH